MIYECNNREDDYTYLKENESSKNEWTRTLSTEKKICKPCKLCNPCNKIRKNIISPSISGEYIFYFDPASRPFIYIIPKQHITIVFDSKNENLIDLYKSIDDFCVFWKIQNYEILIPVFKNLHKHIKIKLLLNINDFNYLRQTYNDRQTIM